jgi:hypothetical protein
MLYFVFTGFLVFLLAIACSFLSIYQLDGNKSTAFIESGIMFLIFALLSSVPGPIMYSFIGRLSVVEKLFRKLYTT